MAPLLRRTFSRDDSRLRAAIRLAAAAAWPGAAGPRRRKQAAARARTSRSNALGVYKNGFTLGTGVRFFTSAFETAWAPFYYATAQQPDARGGVRQGGDVRPRGAHRARGGHGGGRRAMRFCCHADAGISRRGARRSRSLPSAWRMQGVYLLTSIGLESDRAAPSYYPVGTFAALAVGLGSGLRADAAAGASTGAAIAFLLSALTQTTVAFMLCATLLSDRTTKSAASRAWSSLAVLAALAGLWLVPDWPPLAGLVARTVVTAAVVRRAARRDRVSARKTERAFLRDARRTSTPRRRRCRKPMTSEPPATRGDARSSPPSALRRCRSSRFCRRSRPVLPPTTSSSFRASRPLNGLADPWAISASGSSITTGRSPSSRTRWTGSSGG